MKYIFFGTPDFSARLLWVLLAHDIIPAAVVCNPDRPVGRKKIITAPAVKLVAETWANAYGKKIEILQPEKLDAEFVEKLKSFDADFFLVFSYGKIFRKNVLDIPRLGTIGVHPSVLPEYRGASPFATAIKDGKSQTGVTLYMLTEGIDDGPVIARSEPVLISGEDNFSSLAARLADTGGDLILKTLPKFMAGSIASEPQDESKATFTKKFKTEDGFVDVAELRSAESGADPRKAKVIFNMIRALNPEPGVWTKTEEGKRMKMLASKMDSDRIKLTVIQYEGEKPKDVN